MANGGWIAPEDYLEPRCLLCGEPFGKSTEVRAVPQQRIVERLDAYMSRRDFTGAQRHLLYWLEEARLGHDVRGEFMLLGEMMGFFRKTAQKEEALSCARQALSLMETLDNADSLSGATCCINAATVYDAFGLPERALPLFGQAKAVYERLLPASDARLGGLYNNMGLTQAALRRFGEAYESFCRALAVMEKVPHGAPEQAITYLNMADAVEAEHGAEKAEAKVMQYLELAQTLLDRETLVHDGCYAFVCEKCAPVFDRYGWFLYAEELRGRAEEIYERA